MSLFHRRRSVGSEVAVTATQGVLNAVLIFGIAIGLLLKPETRHLAIRTVYVPLLTVLVGVIAMPIGHPIVSVVVTAVGYIWLWIAVNRVTKNASR